MRSHSISLAIAAAVIGMPFRAGDAQPAPSAIEVTSDTLAYCHTLRSRLGALKPDPQAVRLGREGSEMCDQGHVRGGIVRLRRALIIARDPAAADD